MILHFEQVVVIRTEVTSVRPSITNFLLVFSLRSRGKLNISYLPKGFSFRQLNFLNQSVAVKSLDAGEIGLTRNTVDH